MSLEDHTIRKFLMHQIQITSMLMGDILIVMESQVVELVIAALPMLVSSQTHGQGSTMSSLTIASILLKLWLCF